MAGEAFNATEARAFENLKAFIDACHKADIQEFALEGTDVLRLTDLEVAWQMRVVGQGAEIADRMDQVLSNYQKRLENQAAAIGRATEFVKQAFSILSSDASDSDKVTQIMAFLTPGSGKML